MYQYVGKLLIVLAIGFGEGRLLAQERVSDAAGASTQKEDTEPRVLKGHTDEARHAVFSPDSKMLASGSMDGTIRLWDATTGKEIRRLPRNKNYIAELAFSPDGKTLASYGRFYDYKVRSWDVATGKLRYRFSQDAARVNLDNMGVGLAFSPDGATLAVTGLRSTTIDLRSVATGQKTGALEVEGWVDAFAFSPDGKTLAVNYTVAENGDTVGLWDLGKRKLQRTLPKKQSHKTVPTSLTFSSDGKTLAALHEGTIYLWDVISGKQPHVFTKPGTFLGLTFTSTGDVLVLSGAHWPYDGLDVWNVLSGRRVQRFEIGRRGFMGAGFAPDSRLLATAMDDGSVLLWKVNVRQ